MKLIMLLFLWLRTMDVDFRSLAQQPGDHRDPVVPVEQDATRVDTKYAHGVSVLRPHRLADPDLPDRRGPVIRKAPSSHWNYQELPLRSDITGERPYAVLPAGISLSGTNARLNATRVFKRTGGSET
ncbi:MAG TPA: hypothetical protein VEB86_07805 [Chryseosolibacter sp.]|nr:hypothetical protein [Chryseosolibacter sp.]